MTLLGLSIVAIALAMLIMAVGVIFKRRHLRGSFGGILYGPDGDPLNCEACPHRDENPDCERRTGDAA